MGRETRQLALYESMPWKANVARPLDVRRPARLRTVTFHLVASEMVALNNTPPMRSVTTTLSPSIAISLNRL